MYSKEEKFWQRVERIPEVGCWIWMGKIHSYGYGLLGRKKGESGWDYAHRLSWEIHYGKIPEGMCILHKCDTPSCVNPNHLLVGTHQDNMKDRDIKGRNKYGEESPISKLTKEDVMNIRDKCRKGINQKFIANEYNVSQSLVSMINTRTIWKSLE